VAWFVLTLGITSLACSLSGSAFFVGVALGFLGSVLGILALRAMQPGARRLLIARLATAANGLGLAIGLGIWFVHVRAIQTAYRIPERGELVEDFNQRLAGATAPLPGAPPRNPPAPDAEKKTH
jgi:hypothetical protein